MSSIQAGDFQKEDQTLLLTQFSVDVAAEAMFTVSPDGFILNANATACERLEYSKEELLGMRVADVDPNYPAEMWPDHFDELRRRGKMTIETQHRAKSGRIFDVEVSIAYFEFEGTEYCCSSVRDITKAKQAEQLLRLQGQVLGKVASTTDSLTETLNELCRLVEELVPRAMVTVMLWHEKDGALLFGAGPKLTPTVCQAFEPLRPSATNAGSCGAAAILKRPVIVADTRVSPHWTELQHIVREFHLHACWSLPILDERRELLGTIAISHHEVAEPNDFQTQLLETASHLASIAIRKQRFEEQLRVTHAELAHVSRLSTMGEMASSTAHELNQPLACMVNDAFVVEQVAQHASPDLQMIRQRATSIHQQALRAAEIVKGMRNLAKKTAPSRTDVDPCELLDTSLALMEFELRNNGIDLRKQICDPCPIVRADGVQIQQVLLNLIRNSIDAMQGIPRTERSLNIALDRIDDAIRFVVSDTGVGFDSGDPESVFEAFETTKSEGMGMGLTISRSIVEAHLGRLIACSAKPRGAVFTMMLPLAMEPES